MESQPGLAMERGGEGAGWLHCHWDLLGSTGTAPLSRKQLCQGLMTTCKREI